MADATLDPLLLGQRVVAILETGQRDATYKLATLMALIEHCLENLPDALDDTLAVPIPALAHRVLAIYWRQVRPFDGHDLVQRRTGSKARITDATRALRAAAGAGNGGMSLEVAMMRAPAAYDESIDKIVIALAKQPLPRLQKLPGAVASDAFLYDDSFLGEDVSRKRLRAHGDAIVLNPGVASGLARLAGLLKPALEIMWVDDPLDHVLPWSLVGIDGLSNLVLSCARCNGDKRHALPAIAIVDRVLARDRVVLEEIAADLEWPTQHDRVCAAARGIYRGQPSGIPMWSGYKKSERLDTSFPPGWT